MIVITYFRHNKCVSLLDRIRIDHILKSLNDTQNQ